MRCLNEIRQYGELRCLETTSVAFPVDPRRRQGSRTRRCPLCSAPALPSSAPRHITRGAHVFISTARHMFWCQPSALSLWRLPPVHSQHNISVSFLQLQWLQRSKEVAEQHGIGECTFDGDWRLESFLLIASSGLCAGIAVPMTEAQARETCSKRGCGLEVFRPCCNFC